MTWRDRARFLLREPLVHFLLAGAVVFALLSGRPADPGERQIVVNEATVGSLVQRWTMTYRRPPSQEEIDGLIREYVKDQVYYREGLRLGLDRDDEVVIRRMRQKLVALAADEAETREPTDAELRAFFDKDRQRYASEPLIAFSQIYFGEDTAANRAAARAAQIVLERGGPVESLGRPSPLPGTFSLMPASEIDAQFGDGFARSLRSLPSDRWSAPLVSGLGLHLARVDKLESLPPPSLKSIRSQLANDWRSAALARAEEEGYRRLLEGYDVVIEQPK